MYSKYSVVKYARLVPCARLPFDATALLQVHERAVCLFALC